MVTVKTLALWLCDSAQRAADAALVEAVVNAMSVVGAAETAARLVAMAKHLEAKHD